jgi:hypothetical protein
MIGLASAPTIWIEKERTRGTTMKIKRNALLLSLVLTVTTSVVALAQAGGVFDLGWLAAGGGGDTSAGGSYVLAATIGQPGTDRVVGGTYILASGYWAGVDAPGSTPLRRAIFLPLISAD